MKIQPIEIDNILSDKYQDKKINDEFGFTGEYRLCQKDIIDIIIDLEYQDEFIEWIGTNYVKCHGGWFHRYSDQRNINNVKTTDELREIYRGHKQIIPG